jgi:hypothetical protein
MIKAILTALENRLGLGILLAFDFAFGVRVVFPGMINNCMLRFIIHLI